MARSWGLARLAANLTERGRRAVAVSSAGFLGGGDMGHTIVFTLNKTSMPSSRAVRAISALHSKGVTAQGCILGQEPGRWNPRSPGASAEGLGPPVGYGAQADGISSGGLGLQALALLLSLSMPASTFSWCANSSGSATVSTGLLELNRYPCSCTQYSCQPL